MNLHLVTRARCPLRGFARGPGAQAALRVSAPPVCCIGPFYRFDASDAAGRAARALAFVVKQALRASILSEAIRAA
jgi:hypothetical protein